MAPKIRKPAPERDESVTAPHPARRLRAVDSLSVFRTERSGGVSINVVHRPVIACYDVPLQDRSGRWAWAVCLGPRSLSGTVETLAIRRYCFTSAADRRFSWLYSTAKPDETGAKIATLVGRMAESLERSLADTLGHAALIYYAPEGRNCIEMHDHKQVGSNDRTIVLAAEIAAVAL